jgi:amphi-Trp domain-containing protein
MLEQEHNFKHESLQDPESIQDILKSIAKALAKGELTFSDQDGEIILEPNGLLDLKVTAKKQDTEQRLDIRISWKTDDSTDKSRSLTIK